MARTKEPQHSPIDDDYKARSDADTLMRAEEIRGDKDRHQRAQHHVRKRFNSAAKAMEPKGRKGSRFTARTKLQQH